MNAKDPLADHHRKRDFSLTRELGGGEHPGSHEHRYVIQLHDAGTTHFDFRLEVDGVLKSWAVPKGPSGDPHDKRLATPTEDHPLDYQDFEGTIPEGEYGAGTVLIWDEGTYHPLPDRKGRETPMDEALRHGHASFWLDGAKLHGGYALTRFREGQDGEKEAWLLVKRADRRRSDRGAPTPFLARSARSGRTLKQIASASGSRR
ncbi:MULTISPECIES: DNA polymerase ligase N-terminal domain-containing protein [unclassified Streptomyces]|uniref:DNA polymerase ligase N-terminal domain-containing protein n=1 Tax=unclassified Streptomyces TaxID=2593676 RepID=UPI0038053AA9